MGWLLWTGFGMAVFWVVGSLIGVVLGIVWVIVTQLLRALWRLSRRLFDVAPRPAPLPGDDWGE